MAYKETEGSADDTEPTDDLASDLGELDFQEDVEFTEGEESVIAEHDMAKKAAAKGQATKSFSLKARRAIEDHLERRRLRKELDYLFDDGFAEENEDEKKA